MANTNDTSDFKNLLNTLNVSTNDIGDIDGLQKELEQLNTTNNYIDSFKIDQKYQWPVRITPVIKENTQSSIIKNIQHPENWESITNEKSPQLIGHFAPGQYLNPTHPRGHEGIDIVAPNNTPIYPIGPGIVVKTTPSPTNIGGITAYIEHEGGKVVSYYAHMNSVNVSQNEEVDFDTIIGTVGTSGNAARTAPHLHFSVKYNGQLTNPMNIIGKKIGLLSEAYNCLLILEKFSRKI